MKFSRKCASALALFLAPCFTLGPAIAQPASDRCEPVRISKIGYLRDAQNAYVVDPDTNRTRYEVVMVRCQKTAAWATRRFYGAADSITFNRHRYWCVEFFRDGADYRFVRNLHKSACR